MNTEHKMTIDDANTLLAIASNTTSRIHALRMLKKAVGDEIRRLEQQAKDNDQAEHDADQQQQYRDYNS